MQQEFIFTEWVRVQIRDRMGELGRTPAPPRHSPRHDYPVGSGHRGDCRLFHWTDLYDQRLFTYATGNTLSEEQLHDLAAEGKEKEEITVNELLNKFNYQIEIALTQLRNTPDITLLEPRGVGRKQLPSTVLGLLFHAAEHVQRHTGQLLVTAKMLTTA